MSSDLHDPHIASLVENVTEVDRLGDIHSKITTKGPGRKYNVAVLHKSAIVLLVACWEAFVEDLVETALDHLIASVPSPNELPKTVLDRIGSSLSGTAIWRLAGDGWKVLLRDNLKEVLARTTGALNTPKTEQVNQLFERTLGLKGISASWRWKGRTSAQAAKSLDALITLRGSIADRVKSSRRVTLRDVREARDLIFRLSVKTHNRASRFLESQVGSTPWSLIIFKGTS